MIAYKCDAIRNGDGCQAAAAIESKTAYRCNSVGDGDGCQATAVIESITAYRGDSVGYVDGCQAAATIESSTAYRGDSICGVIIGDAVWDGQCPSRVGGVIRRRLCFDL